MRGILPGKGGSRTRTRRVPRRAPAVSTALAAGIALALALTLALAACGDLSLVEALKGDSAGDLRLSPATALVPLSTPFTFNVQGGFRPYDITVGGTLIPKTTQTWVFPGQDTISGESQDFTIQATDLLGVTATAVVRVYNLPELELNVQEVTLVPGMKWVFSAKGGKYPYAWAANDAPQAPDPDADPVLNDSFTFSASEQGSFLVSVTDSIGLSTAATARVLSDPGPGSDLVIAPTKASVLAGGRLAFTALGGTGPYSFGAASGAFDDPTANPATYVAPTGITDPTSYTVSLTDGDGNNAEAAITVIPAGHPLTLSPLGPSVSANGDTIQFTASGGATPYTFSTLKPEQGTIDPKTGLYTQLGGKSNLVTVTDGAGTAVNTPVKFR